MSFDALDKFWTHICEYEDAQRRLHALDPKEGIAPIVNLAHEIGYDFTEAELTESLQKSRGELSQEQLEAVAGGGNFVMDPSSVNFRALLSRAGYSIADLSGCGGRLSIEDPGPSE